MLFDSNVRSFSIDHTKLVPGLYVQQELKVGGQSIYVYDLRFKSPNSRKSRDFIPLKATAIHTIEHLLAFKLRDVAVQKKFKAEDILYFGPMGCRTGFYCLATLDLCVFTSVLGKALDDVLNIVDIPAMDEKLCGDWTLHSLSAAKLELANFKRILESQEDYFPPLIG